MPYILAMACVQYDCIFLIHIVPTFRMMPQDTTTMEDTAYTDQEAIFGLTSHLVFWYLRMAGYGVKASLHGRFLWRFFSF